MPATETTNEATILPNQEVFEVWANDNVLFTNADRIECYYWALANGYQITN